MNIVINRDSERPIYKQIAMSIEDMIEKQELVRGNKLPSERQLADKLNVHRNTVIRAYDELISKGLVQASRKRPRGYFVEVCHEQNFSKRFFPLEKAFQYEVRRAEKKFNEIYLESNSNDIISFGGMIMSRNVFNISNMGKVVTKIFSGEKESNTDKFAEETQKLKERICERLTSQHIYATSKNIQIVAETNQAISYLMMLYVKEGDCVVAEEPIVPDTLSIFYNHGVNVITVPMEKDGMGMDKLEECIRIYKPKFIYTMPSFHNPTGISMSLKKRQKLLELANTYNIPVIEDDYQKNFQYTEEGRPSLYALDRNKLVVYMDSFTLSFPFGVKVGFVVGPSDMVNMMGHAISIDETLIGNIGQYFINHFIESGQYDKHLISSKIYYKKKLDLLCRMLDTIIDKGIYYDKPEGGLILWCTLDKDINERLLCKIARSKGLIVIPGWIFYSDDKEEKGHLRLSFSNISDEQIVEGVARLGESLDECRAIMSEKKRKL